MQYDQRWTDPKETHEGCRSVTARGEEGLKRGCHREEMKKDRCLSFIFSFTILHKVSLRGILRKIPLMAG